MYREFRPPELSDVVHSVWTNTLDHTGLVMPDGCMDLMWTGDELIVAGPDTVAHLADGDGRTVVGVRFQPGIAPGFLGVPGKTLQNIRIPLADIWDRDRVEQLADRLRGGNPGQVLRDIAATAEPDGFAEVVHKRAKDSGDVRAMAAELGCTERHLHRLCLTKFGYGPKTLHRVLRFNHAMNLAYSGTAFADAANQTGYADQAHLSREVKSLTGTTLTELVRKPT
jgi:AraC-like DNA-binding protein